ncbi:MAG: PEP/pyruvate-binding domain-containing protein [Pseudomonadota bacterium]
MDIQNQFLSGGFPLEVTRQIQAAIDILREKSPREALFLAVRSSAWGEDSLHSFAGQYKTFLNVPADQLLDSYRKVLASAYSPGVLSYRHQKGFHIHELAMSVGCQVMVKAKASGVIYTLDTLSADKDVLLATAAWGLGAPVVDGSVATDQYRITRTPPYTISGFNVVHKSTMMVAAKNGGTAVTPVPEELRQKACLTPELAQKLAETALLIERYFKRPQDIEWAIDSQDRVMILQARPLNIQLPAGCAKDQLDISAADHPVMLKNQGVVVQRGVAAGKVFILEDITSVPMKAFLEGLTAPGMWSTEPMSVDFGSFMSSLTRTYSDSTTRFSGRNLAVLSAEYLDLNLRLGYHYNIIDAYIAEKQNDNYAYFRFLGGVTDVTRRSRRARFIGEVLERFNFRVEIRGDLVVGRIKKLDPAAMYEKVKMLGSLVAYTRQLDVQMHSDENIADHVTDFFKGAINHDIGSENNRITFG